MIRAIAREKPALCFFLGDGERDLAQVQARFPALPFYAVRGNCDWRSALSASIVCTVGGVCIFATHGHLYEVKHEPNLDSLLRAAEEAGASLALFGHTHLPLPGGARRDHATQPRLDRPLGAPGVCRFDSGRGALPGGAEDRLAAAGRKQKSCGETAA